MWSVYASFTVLVEEAEEKKLRELHFWLFTVWYEIYESLDWNVCLLTPGVRRVSGQSDGDDEQFWIMEHGKLNYVVVIPPWMEALHLTESEYRISQRECMCEKGCHNRHHPNSYFVMY